MNQLGLAKENPDLANLMKYWILVGDGMVLGSLLMKEE